MTEKKAKAGKEKRQLFKEKQVTEKKGCRRFFKVFLVGLGLLVVLLLGLGVWAYHYFGQSVYEEVQYERKRHPDEALENRQSVSILLTGLDKGALFYKDVKDGRTDVMMLMTIDPKKERTVLTSIPRDALGPMDTTNDFDKLNHAYMKYGISGTLNSLQRYLDLPIDYYVNVDMQGFIDIIDGMGGIEITPTQTFTQNGVHFDKGKRRKLSGVEAIHYVRMRKKDPEGDIGRQKRQQQMVEAVADKVLSLDTITNLDEITKKLGASVKTNLSIGDMYVLQSNYLAALKNIQKLVVSDIQDLNLSFGYYMLVKEKGRRELANALRQNLGLGPTQSTILYPIEYGVDNLYLNVKDQNGDGLINSSDMLVPAGVYTAKDLKAKLKAKEADFNGELVPEEGQKVLADLLKHQDKNPGKGAGAKQPIVNDNAKDAPKRNKKKASKQEKTENEEKLVK